MSMLMSGAVTPGGAGAHLDRDMSVLGSADLIQLKGEADTAFKTAVRKEHKFLHALSTSPRPLANNKPLISWVHSRVHGMHKEINRLKELLQPIKQLAEAATVQEEAAMVQEENDKLRAQVAALEAAAAAAASDSGAESEELYHSQELQVVLAAADKQAGEIATPPPVADKSTAADDLDDNELNDQLAEQVKISGGL